jgi:hypothetical protein
LIPQGLLVGQIDSRFAAINYSELPTSIRRGLSGHSWGNGKGSVHKLGNGSKRNQPRPAPLLASCAEQANFFEHGKNRLVMPAVAVRDAPPENPEIKKNKNGGDAETTV